MKKILWIMAVLLLTTPLPAARGEGFDDYLIKTGEPIAVCALSAHDAIVRCWPERRADLDTEPWYLLWLRDGKEYRRLPYYVHGATGDLDHTDFFLKPDGDVQVLLYRNDGTFLYDWTEKGLENPVQLPAGWGYRVCGSFLAAARLTERGEMELTLYAADRTPLLTGVLPGSQAGDALDVWPFEKDGFLFHLCSAKRDLFLCVQAGTVCWQVQIEEKRHYFPDGRGGFFAVENNTAGDYTPQILTHYGSDGQPGRRFGLRREKLVTQIQGATYDAQRDRTILYGYAVANSRRVYTVFALTLDAEQNAVSWDVRAVPARYRDYSPRCYLAPGGAAWVYIWGVGLEDAFAYSPALAPFDVLPAEPSVTLNWREVLTWHPGVQPN